MAAYENVKVLDGDDNDSSLVSCPTELEDQVREALQPAQVVHDGELGTPPQEIVLKVKLSRADAEARIRAAGF